MEYPALFLLVILVSTLEGVDDLKHPEVHTTDSVNHSQEYDTEKYLQKPEASTTETYADYSEVNTTNKTDDHSQQPEIHTSIGNSPGDVCKQYPWAIPINNNTQCKCGDNLQGVINCDSNTLKTSLLICHCMAFSEIYNKTLVGYCIINCPFLDYRYKQIGGGYDGRGCTQHNNVVRTGQNCGDCPSGRAPAVYSYMLACVECKDYKYNWLKYIAVAFLPLTIFYIIIVVFRINVTSGPLNTYVLTSQLIAAPVQLRLMTLGGDTISTVSFKITSSLYMLWNLDIFRAFYNPFCLHPKTTTLQALALEYAVAVYPMILIIITYLLVRIHDNHVTIVRLWRPFYKVFIRVRNGWDIRSSLVHAFVTFLLLSYVKIANISFDLLTPVTLYDVHGEVMPKRYLYYTGTVEYFGRAHLPYAILALFMCFLFNVVPLLLLCLDPSRWVHTVLNFCHISSTRVRFFIDVCQGDYKIKPYDCRYFAGIYLGYRLVNLALFAVTTSPMYYTLAGTSALLTTALIAIAKPYHNHWYVALDVFFFALQALICLGLPAFTFIHLIDPSHVHAFWYRYAYPLILIPPVYGIGLLIYKLLPKKLLEKLKEGAKSCYRHCRRRANYEQLGSVPYRIDHPEEYPLIVDTLHN